MLLTYLAKTANLLDSVGTEQSTQAAEGIDAVLASLHKQATDPVLSFYKELNELESKIAAVAAAADQSGVKDYIDGFDDLFGSVGQAVASLADRMRGDEGLDIAGRLDAQHPSVGDDRENTRGEPLVPSPIDLGQEGVLASEVFNRLSKVADIIDEDGSVEAANIIDGITKEAMDLPSYPSRMETREPLYNAKKRNEENMFEVVKREVTENRQKHHLRTMQDHAESLSTRYSPELPGVQVLHVADGVYQDALTKKIYDFNQGWSGTDGQKYPGGSVKNQTPALTQYYSPSRLFDI